MHNNSADQSIQRNNNNNHNNILWISTTNTEVCSPATSAYSRSNIRSVFFHVFFFLFVLVAFKKCGVQQKSNEKHQSKWIQSNIDTMPYAFFSIIKWKGTGNFPMLSHATKWERKIKTETTTNEHFIVLCLTPNGLYWLRLQQCGSAFNSYLIFLVATILFCSNRSLCMDDLKWKYFLNSPFSWLLIMSCVNPFLVFFNQTLSKFWLLIIFLFWNLFVRRGAV